MVRSGQFDEVITVLDASPSSPAWILVTQALVDAAPATISLLIEEMLRAPLSRRALSCIGCLGNIACNQGATRDPRLVPALLGALSAVVTEAQSKALPLAEIEPIGALLVALRNCIRGGPIPDFPPLAYRITEILMNIPDPPGGMFEDLFHVLAASTSREEVIRLRGELREHPQGHSWPRGLMSSCRWSLT